MVAETILAQLGGRKAAFMIGMKFATTREDGVGVRFAARAKNGANHVEITLDPSDTYTVKLYSIRGRVPRPKMLSEHTDVYADSLRSLFTGETGLYLNL